MPPSLKLMALGAFGLVGEVIVFGVLVYLLEKENRRRGVLVQAIFRSNFVIMGIPIIGNVYGQDALAVPTMMIAVIVPLYNIFGVLVLEMFRGNSFKLDLLGLIRSVLRNPMILGGLLGAAIKLIGLELPAVVLKPIAQLAAATTPIALIILGASFKLGSFHNHLKQLIAALVSRLVIVPAVMMLIAVSMGFRGVELLTLFVIFGAPCAVAGYAMAQAMGGDAELAGNCVVYSSAASVVTIFGWVFLLTSLGFV